MGRRRERKGSGVLPEERNSEGTGHQKEGRCWSRRKASGKPINFFLHPVVRNREFSVSAGSCFPCILFKLITDQSCSPLLAKLISHWLKDSISKVITSHLSISGREDNSLQLEEF